MPVEQLRDLQLERMKKTVQHSYDNVAFYQRSFKEAGVEPGDLKTLEDLPKFPFVVKQDMRDAYPFGLFAVPQKDVARIHASSGTTGQATVVGHTANDLKNWGDCFARGIHMVNGNEDSTIQVSYGYGLFTGGLGAHYGGEAAGCTVIPTSSGNTKRQIQMMKDLGTDILACTPSYALLIADTAIEMGYDPAVDFKISAGIFGAEPASESMREDIRKKLGIQYCDVYGLSEVMGPGVAMACMWRRIISTPRSWIPIRSSPCPTASTASSCSPRSRASAARSCATAPATSRASSPRSARADAPTARSTASWGAPTTCSSCAA